MNMHLRLYIFLFSIIGATVTLNAQKKKLSSGAFSKYDKVFSGNIDTIKFPDYTEGPHFFWIDSKMVRMQYVDHDRKENKISIREKRIKIKKDSVLIKGLKGDSNKYWLLKNDYPLQKAEFKGVKKIIAIGDVHGEYHTMINLLKNNGVIDEDLNWSWDDGHLVFIGDIFDRGNKVTESLYLIKKLQRQAKENKGRVHLILGNHEVMVLMDDSRYVAPKYKQMCKKLMINYPRFFKRDTELGRWLRSLNSIVKINDLIFVHGGLSPDLVKRNLSLEKINKDIRESLNTINEKTKEELMKTIYFPENPLWYRGYFMKTRNYPIISNRELSTVLNYFKISKIFIGHTEVESIRFLHDHKIGAINVPMGYENIKPQVLFVENGCFYRCFIDGSKELIL